MSSIAARRVNTRACQLQPNGMVSRGTHAYPGANDCSRALLIILSTLPLPSVRRFATGQEGRKHGKYRYRSPSVEALVSHP